MKPVDNGQLTIQKHTKKELYEKLSLLSLL